MTDPAHLEHLYPEIEPYESGMLLVPMALVTGLLAPYVGRLVDRAHPRWIAMTAPP